MSTRNELVRIGWRERVDLPTWGLAGVRAKIDTGARTSVIDVAQIETIDEGHVRFEVVWRLRPDRLTKWIEAEAVRTSRVKPSTGELQERVVCVTTLRIGEIERQIELALVCRQNMRCRMLIGRKALEGVFLVDPSRAHILTGRRPGRGKP